MEVAKRGRIRHTARVQKPSQILRDPIADPVYLAAAVVGSQIQLLPADTAFFIGVVLLTMMTGCLVHHKGSLARDTLPFVRYHQWAGRRVERAMDPWDRKPARSASLMVNYLDLHAAKFTVLALGRVAQPDYPKIPKSSHIKDLPDEAKA